MEEGIQGSVTFSLALGESQVSSAGFGPLVWERATQALGVCGRGTGVPWTCLLGCSPLFTKAGGSDLASGSREAVSSLWLPLSSQGFPWYLVMLSVSARNACDSPPGSYLRLFREPYDRKRMAATATLHLSKR